MHKTTSYNPITVSKCGASVMCINIPILVEMLQDDLIGLVTIDFLHGLPWVPLVRQDISKNELLNFANKLTVFASCNFEEWDNVFRRVMSYKKHYESKVGYDRSYARALQFYQEHNKPIPPYADLPDTQQDALKDLNIVITPLDRETSVSVAYLATPELIKFCERHSIKSLSEKALLLAAIPWVPLAVGNSRSKAHDSLQHKLHTGRMEWMDDPDWLKVVDSWVRTDGFVEHTSVVSPMPYSLAKILELSENNNTIDITYGAITNAYLTAYFHGSETERLVLDPGGKILHGTKLLAALNELKASAVKYLKMTEAGERTNFTRCNVILTKIDDRTSSLALSYPTKIPIIVTF